MNSHPVARLLAACLLWGGLTFPVTAADIANLAPNPDFTAGRDGPSGWKVAIGRGHWADRTALQIEGTGHEAEYWQSAPLRFEPGRDYRFMHYQTDATGVRGWWPDALPPLDRPIDVAAGTNQPLWVLVDVPGDVAP